MAYKQKGGHASHLRAYVHLFLSVLGDISCLSACRLFRGGRHVSHEPQVKIRQNSAMPLKYSRNRVLRHLVHTQKCFV